MEINRSYINVNLHEQFIVRTDKGDALVPHASYSYGIAMREVSLFSHNGQYSEYKFNENI